MELRYFSKIGCRLDGLMEQFLAVEQDSKKFRLKLLCIAIACIGIAILTWYPGIFSDDTTAQYRQAIGVDPVTDWHPPLTMRLWQLESALLGTTNLIDAAYILLAGMAVYIYLRERPCKLSLSLYVPIFFSPLFYAVMGFTDKDFLLSYILFFILGIYLSLINKGKVCWWQKILIVSFLLLVSFLRFNAIFMVAPLIVMIVMGWRFSVWRLGGCLVQVVLLLVVTGPVNHNILGAEAEHPETQLEVFDIAGIARYSNPKEDDNVIFKNWNTATLSQKLSACYHPFNWDRFGAWIPRSERPYHILVDQWGVQGIVSDRLPSPLILDPRVRECYEVGDSLRKVGSEEELHQKWIAAIVAHPGAYFHHRWKYFRQLISGYLWKTDAIGFRPGHYSYDWAEQEPSPHWFSSFYTILLDRHIVHIPTSYGAKWLEISLFLFVASFACRNKCQQFVNCCSFAALMYLLGYYFVGVGGMFRYILPAAYLVLASFFAIFIFRKPLGTSRSYKIGAVLAGVIWLIF